ncbi:MAG: hypothetical protein HY754_13180 [Nitrospirae bacterium]|nr:hypothetical protein [Nitrospirota bacterium]
MPDDLSPGLTLTWQIAANEAAHAHHQFIEKEHVFIGLCKVKDSEEIKKYKADDTAIHGEWLIVTNNNRKSSGGI